MQRRAALARLVSSSAAHSGGVVAGCERDNEDKKAALVNTSGATTEAGGWRAARGGRRGLRGE
eukprot:1896543-Prymnesium_polylepis.1